MASSDIIQLLPDSIANQIAAGEVVQRPASVVKELLENAIDAGSTVIEIEVEEAGLAKIRITDNGHGIDEEDVLIAFQRHATSKIKNESDLVNGPWCRSLCKCKWCNWFCRPGDTTYCA